MQAALAHLEAHRDRFLELLFEFLEIPSVSTQAAHLDDMRRAAAFARERLAQAGFETGLYEGDGHPTVHGSRHEGDDRPTLLLYGHYDVQPPEPLDLWDTPPFEPAVRDGFIHARGCADDKGPSLALVFAAECWVKGEGSLPVNLKVIFEGEEECGGNVVERYLEDHREALQGEALVIADTSGVAAGTPALCYSLRGLVAAELTVTGPRQDLHSGSYGGTVANPATALARIVASLHDSDGRVAVEGFYEGARPVDALDRDRLGALPFDEGAYLEETGSPALFGEDGYTTLERKGLRPTCEINGIYGGYDGAGIKTIVPARAGCKITCRLVPGQCPEAVFAALQRHVDRHCPPGVRVALEPGHRAPAVYTDPETKWARAARSALERAFGRPAALTCEGGSIPVIDTFRRVLDVQPLLLGIYAPGEHAHSPNERLRVEDFYAGILTGIHLFSGAGKPSAS